VNRRDLLKSSVAGALGLWAAPRTFGRPLTDKVAVLDGGGANVVAFSTDDGLVLVDSGAPKSFAAPSKVHTLFNTHYHADQTGNNETFAAQGAKIIAHERTRQWMASPSQSRPPDRGF
jgi:glyoxylase-like metal-dependent hydrolase (beta-lactamase superfamily II)